MNKDKRCPQCIKRDDYMWKLRGKLRHASFMALNNIGRGEYYRRKFKEEVVSVRRAKYELKVTKESLKFWRLTSAVLVVMVWMTWRLL